MLRKYILYVIVLFLYSRGAVAQNKQDVVSEKEYYGFYNSISQPNRSRHFVLESEPERFDTFNSLFETKYNILDTIFPQSDTTFLKEQIVQAANFFWGPGMIDGSTVVNKADIDRLFNGDVDEGWSRFDQLYGDGGFCQYSVPLFSHDRTICVILHSYHCGGLCGEGDLDYYKKINGEWKLVYHKGLWIS